LFVNPFDLIEDAQSLTVSEAIKLANFQSYHPILPPDVENIDVYFKKDINKKKQNKIGSLRGSIIFNTQPGECLGGIGATHTTEIIQQSKNLFTARTVSVDNTLLETYPTAVENNGLRWIRSYLFKHTIIYPKDNYVIACRLGGMF
jgi:hypothetical protein